jgi:hypothetical protein
MKPSRFQKSAAATADFRQSQQVADDAAIASVIAEEAERRRERAKSAGVLAYLEPDQTAASTEVNKRFLGSMITSVLGHNRRNQEGQCWRAKGLEPVVEGMARQASSSVTRDNKDGADSRSRSDRHFSQDRNGGGERQEDGLMHRDPSKRSCGGVEESRTGDGDSSQHSSEGQRPDAKRLKKGLQDNGHSFSLSRKSVDTRLFQRREENAHPSQRQLAQSSALPRNSGEWHNTSSATSSTPSSSSSAAPAGGGGVARGTGHHDHQASSREEWALRKARAMQGGVGGGEEKGVGGVGGTWAGGLEIPAVIEEGRPVQTQPKSHKEKKKKDKKKEKKKDKKKSKQKNKEKKKKNKKITGKKSKTGSRSRSSSCCSQDSSSSSTASLSSEGE